MGENPLRNEPGYDNLANDDHKLNAYNEIISHEVVRVAYIGMILNPPTGMPDELHSWVLEQAPKHLETQRRAVARHKHLNKQKFDFFENKAQGNLPVAGDGGSAEGARGEHVICLDGV